MNILIADDDPILTRLLASRLQTRGWRVSIASDAMQVLMFAMKSQPDVIVLDIGMPGGGGVEALRKLKLSARTRHIPVLVVTGSVESGAEGVVTGLGAAGFLRKPVDPEALHLAALALLVHV